MYKRVGPLALFCIDHEHFPPIASLPQMHGIIQHLRSAMRPSKSLLAIAAALLTAVLAYFGTGLNPFWPLLWFAPVPVLVVATGLRPFHAFLVALLAWLGGELNQWT